MALSSGLGGAAVVDALLGGLITIDDGAVTATGASTDDPLLQHVLDELSKQRERSRTVDKLVPRVGTDRFFRLVRARLVERQRLRSESRRVLGIFPVTRYPLVDHAEQAELRGRVRELVTGDRNPEDAEVADRMLASLAGSIDALKLLISERKERKAAEERAEAFGQGHGIPSTVGDAVAEAQLAIVAAMAAVTAASTAASSSSASSSGSC